MSVVKLSVSRCSTVECNSTTFQPQRSSSGTEQLPLCHYCSACSGLVGGVSDVLCHMACVVASLVCSSGLCQVEKEMEEFSLAWKDDNAETFINGEFLVKCVCVCVYGCVCCESQPECAECV